MTDYAPTTWANDPATSSPVNATNLNKMEAQLDALSDFFRQGPSKKALAATTGNITLSGVQTIDGTALSAGQRCFVRMQNTASQNGLYIVAVGAWTRAPEADDGTELCGGTLISVERGTVNGGKVFRCTNTGAVTINTTALTFTEIVASAGGGTSYLTDGTTPVKYSAFLAAAGGNHQAAFQNAINHIFTSSAAYGTMLDLEGAKVNLTGPVTVPTSGTTGGTKSIYNGIIEAQAGFSGGDYMLSIMGDVQLAHLRLENLDFDGNSVASWIKWDRGNLFINSCKFNNNKAGTDNASMISRAGLWCADGGVGGNADAGFFISQCWFACSDAAVQPTSRWRMGIRSQTGDNKINATTMSYFRHCCQFEAPGVVLTNFHPFQGTPSGSMNNHTASLKFTNGKAGATIAGLYLGKSFLEISNETNQTQRAIGEIAISNGRMFMDNIEAGAAHLVVRDYSSGGIAGDGLGTVTDITITNCKFINGGTTPTDATKHHNPAALDRDGCEGIYMTQNTFETTSGVADVNPQANPCILSASVSAANTATKDFDGFLPFATRPVRVLNAIHRNSSSNFGFRESSIGTDGTVTVGGGTSFTGDVLIEATCNNPKPGTFYS